MLFRRNGTYYIAETKQKRKYLRGWQYRSNEQRGKNELVRRLQKPLKHFGVDHMRMRASKATEGDAYAIPNMSSEVAKESIVKEFNSQEVKELLSDKKYYIVVGKLDGGVVGYAVSTYSWGKLHVLDIAVKKSERRKGIGRMLIKHLISHALEKGDLLRGKSQEYTSAELVR